MEDVVPAMQFIGEVVRVTTTLERAVPKEYEFDTDELGGMPDEPEMVSLVLLGTVLDSDAIYLTLGVIDEEGNPKPKVALKHNDVKIIEYYNEDEGVLDEVVDGVVN